MAGLNFDDLAQQALKAPAQPPGQGAQVLPFPQQPGAAPGGQFDDLAGQVIDMQRQADSARLMQAQRAGSPDDAAKALQISRQTGVPATAVETNLDAASKSVQVQHDQQILFQNPKLQQFVADNPLAARMAQDDFDKLGFIEKMTTAISTGEQSAILQNKLGRLGTFKQAAGLFGMDAPETDAGIRSIESSLSSIPNLHGGYGFAQSLTGFAIGLADNALHGGSLGMAAGAGAGAIWGGIATAPVGGVGAVPGSVAGAAYGFAAGTAADMARVQAGNAYIRMSQMRGADGQPISEAGKQVGAVLTGTATYLLGQYGGAVAGKAIGDAAPQIAGRALDEALTRPTFQAALRNLATNTAVAAGKGGALMAAMEGSSILGEQVGQALSPGKFDSDPEQMVQRLADAFVNGAVTLGAMHAAGHGLALYGDWSTAQRAAEHTQAFEGLMQGASESKLRSRDLQTFQDFMHSQTDGTPVENLYIPAQKIRELYQSAKLNPEEFNVEQSGADPLFGWVKDMPQQLREASATGGDVVIPTADYVAHMAGSPLSEHLLPDIRVGQNAMSLNEARAFAAEYPQRLQEAVKEQAGAEPTSQDKIAADVQRQAQAAGYSTTVAGKYGQLYAARYGARGERMGVDPWESYKESGLQILPAGKEPEAQGRVLAQNERGSIKLADSGKIISLFKGADPSTLLHESGHAWLEELASDAANEKAPEQIKSDMATVRTWLGNEGGEFSTEQHEQFARAAEAYMMEGKAPSRGLAGVFSRFKTWLTKIYKTVTGLDTPINDHIRGVFDRMLATDSEIEQAGRQQGLEPAFKDRQSSGMTQAEWAQYVKRVGEAKQEAESTLLEKAMAPIRRQRAAEYKEQSAPVREQITKEVDERKDIQAWQMLTRGIQPDGTKGEPIKINREWVVAMYGKDAVANLPRGILAKAPDGEHPDNVAETLGYPSGDAMMQDVMALEAKQRELRATEGERRGIRQWLIDTGTDAAMRDKHGDILDDGSIRDEAMAAVHSDKQEQLLATELRYLNRKNVQALIGAGEKRQDVGLQRAVKESVNVSQEMLGRIRDHAKAILDTKTTDELGNYDRYARDERKAAQDVQRAILAKDGPAAAAAKQRQLLASVLYRASREASEFVDRSTTMMQRLADKPTFERISQPFVDQIHALLDRFGVKVKRDPDELARAVGTKSLSEFVGDQLAAGYEVPLTNALAAGAGRLEEMRLPEFRDLVDVVTSLKSAGTDAGVFRTFDKEFALADAIDPLVQAIYDLAPRFKSDFLNPKSAPLATRVKDKAFSAFRYADASMLKKEGLADQIDKSDPMGPANTFFFRPLKDAQGRRDLALEAASVAFADSVRQMPKGWRDRFDTVLPADGRIIDPETGMPAKMKMKEAISMALNFGNQGNKNRLSAWLFRARSAVDHEQAQRTIKSFLDDRLTKDDWAFVQRTWDLFEKHRDEIDALQRRVTGIGLKFVDAVPFSTPHGEMRGGYFPIVEDRTKTQRGQEIDEKESVQAMFPSSYGRATPQGHTIERVDGVSRPLSLDLDVIPWKIHQALHDLTMREAVMNANKIVTNSKFVRAMNDVFGPEYQKMLRPWLQRIANSANVDDEAMQGWNKFLDRARTNTTIMGVGFRATTFYKHTMTAISNGFRELGPTDFLSATRDFFNPFNREATWDMVKEKSPDMAFRMKHYDQDLRQTYDNIFKDGALTKFQKKVAYYGHVAISYFDLGSAIPVWVGAYRKGLANGMADADAVYFADKTVRNAHGAQGITDKAPIQEINGALGLTTMFMGFMNHVYNRSRFIAVDAATGVREARAGNYKMSAQAFAHSLAGSFYLIAIPAIIDASATQFGPDEDKDESWAGWAGKAIATGLAAPIPFARDIMKSIIEGKDYEPSPVVRAVSTIAKTPKEAWKYAQGDATEEDERSLAKHAVESVGYATGLPTSAPYTAGRFLADVNNGTEDPQDLAEWIRGLTRGKARAH